MEISIKPFLRSNLDSTFLWMQNEQMKSDFMFDKIVTWETHEKWFKNYQKDFTQECFGIYYLSTHVGNIGLKNIDIKNYKAEAWLYIGEEKYRGKGIAREALSQLVKYCFKELNYHKIYAHILEHNLSSLKLFASVGFEQEAYLKDEFFFKGKFVSLYRYFLLNQE